MEKEIQQRNTWQRQVVKDAVMARSDHPSADDIYLDVRSQNSSVSRGTVYRNLSILSENGEIGHVRVPGADRYDKTIRLHYHMICVNCRKVMDAPFSYDESKDRMCEEATGFRIKRHRTVFEGICPDCLAKEPGPEASVPDTETVYNK